MRFVAMLRNVRYLRYIIVSAAALGIDSTVFLIGMELGVAAALAGAIGYLAGVVGHWFLSTRIVFHDDVADGGAERHKQKALFLTSAFIGLGLTVGIIALAVSLGYDPRLAKLAAIAVSFNVTYLLRQRVVFS
jgi:putative flippase GtrA